MNAYKDLIRPLLFKLDAETAHDLARALLRRPLLGGLLPGKGRFVHDERLRVDLGGITISNPIGLGAGFDKDGDMVNSLMRLGFGYIVTGSVMCHPRPGNPRPRMVRDPGREALYSCMGLPSRGLDYAVKHLRGSRPTSVPLIVNLNGTNLQEYLRAFETLQPLADALEITLFCPNRPSDAGDFLSPAFAETFFAELARRKKKPVFIKIPGYITESERERRLELVGRLLKYPLEGISITPESRISENRLSIGRGTLTGRPLLPQMLRVVRDVYRLVGNTRVIKASGGVFTAEDAFAAIAAGASSVEIVTGLIYEGWGIAGNINRRLLPLMDQHHIENVRTLRGIRL